MSTTINPVLDVRTWVTAVSTPRTGDSTTSRLTRDKVGSGGTSDNICRNAGTQSFESVLKKGYCGVSEATNGCFQETLTNGMWLQVILSYNNTCCMKFCGMALEMGLNYGVQRSSIRLKANALGTYQRISEENREDVKPLWYCESMAVCIAAVVRPSLSTARLTGSHSSKWRRGKINVFEECAACRPTTRCHQRTPVQTELLLQFTMPLANGIYKIKNVRTENYVALHSARNDLVASDHVNRKGEDWEVTFRYNDRYFIQNCQFKTYAGSYHRPHRPTEFIRTTDVVKYWCFEDDQPNSQVVLRGESPGNTYYLWKFEGIGATEELPLDVQMPLVTKQSQLLNETLDWDDMTRFLSEKLPRVPEATFMPEHACLAGTRTGLLKTINEWTTASDSIYWLTGPAGADRGFMTFGTTRSCETCDGSVRGSKRIEVEKIFEALNERLSRLAKDERGN
ncbi:hypothetical protein BD410DRAFT_804312 [Rickenella mellea]|uniref:Ricin B lectin domain-containing protein n=1 Tax=Rickenella mellea TaxID=50990 RepID=A0A4Y7Q181_9AGAM|nr:hypothetical protein BD410DRAFT_804312 [Rickenella mellea]